MDTMDIARMAIVIAIIGIVVMVFGAMIGNATLMAWTFLVLVVGIAVALIAMLFS